jgi:tetratricopeptide (TPR) repeat protein
VQVNLATLYQSQNQAQKAHDTLVESISLFHEANYATCSYNQGKASSASQDKDSIVGALAGLGIQLKNKGDFDSAISAYATAIDFKKSAGESEDDFSFFSLFINIGMAYKGKREFQEQINWLEKAVVLMEQNRNHPSVRQVYSGVLQHILAAAQQIGDQDRIQIYLQKIGA